MRITVHQPQRYAKMRAHTATHLFHAALAKIIGQTRQEWSLVDEDYVRFDFATKEILSSEDIRQIEDEINNIIVQWCVVSIQEMSLEEAKKTGAKMFFGEKYGETVRVVSIGDELSVELCGGTHVHNTREIGACVIVGQESVASGIKRIIAYTGPKVAWYAQEKQSLIDTITSEVGIAGESQLLPKIQKMLTEKKEQTSLIESLKTKLVGGVLQAMDLQKKWVFDGIIAIDKYPDLQWLKIKTIAAEARNIFHNQTILLHDAQWIFALLSLGDTSAKTLAKELWLRWWWSDDLVQGRDAEILHKIS